MDDRQMTPLRRWRHSTGLSLRELERRTGIGRGRLSVIERGLPPTPAEMASIEAALRQGQP